MITRCFVDRKNETIGNSICDLGPTCATAARNSPYRNPATRACGELRASERGFRHAWGADKSGDGKAYASCAHSGKRRHAPGSATLLRDELHAVGPAPVLHDQIPFALRRDAENAPERRVHNENIALPVKRRAFEEAFDLRKQAVRIGSLGAAFFAEFRFTHLPVDNTSSVVAPCVFNVRRLYQRGSHLTLAI